MLTLFFFMNCLKSVIRPCCVDFFKQICGNWYDWFDPESGVSSYIWAVGTQPLISNVVNFVKVSRREHGTCSGYVTLQHGETYYSTLVAFHGGFDKLNVSASSNGGSFTPMLLSLPHAVRIISHFPLCNQPVQFV